MNYFWGSFDIKRAATDDLEYLAAASEEAANMAASLSKQVTGIGCLILADRSSSSTAKSGSLQGDSQVHLLFDLANQVEVIGKMAQIGSDCEYELRRRLSSQLEKRTSRRMPSAEYSSSVMEGA
ncbi:TPA: hypothetical protein QDB15_006005 [Burkholderia vietnamiensis]|nr:hypothetical protein [Burkholderia vietnamiensis]HDR9122134.1 hypothetical protein [Burkholderia vietnamiensis]HDR9167966.1 hypothetical protein [Burkholderia vietnamiensis]